MPETAATTNACKLCTPLGACLAMAGFERCVPVLHGSQGCATYMRRYLISHFNEPVDIASSSFGEDAAVFGGEANLLAALTNVNAKYEPALIGVATTCLAETIGDDVPAILSRFEAERRPHLISVSTPAYRGTHADGFHATVLAAVRSQAAAGPRGDHANVFAGMMSPADYRHLDELLRSLGLQPVLLPDYRDTLDGPALAEYRRLPEGGATLADLAASGRAGVSIQCGRLLADTEHAAGDWLEREFGVPCLRVGLPIGVRETDALVDALANHCGAQLTPEVEAERGRLIDSYVDGHKYVSGRRAVVYGEEDLVLGLTSFLAEIGIVPAIVATGAAGPRLADELAKLVPDQVDRMVVLTGADFEQIETAARAGNADLLVGHSKGYGIARRLGIPLVRVGFPIHDRLGGQRLLHLGYRGTQQLFDRVVNALIEHDQDASPVGYAYM